MRQAGQTHLAEMMIEAKGEAGFNFLGQNQAGAIGIAPGLIAILEKNTPQGLFLSRIEDDHFDKPAVAQAQAQLQSDRRPQPGFGQGHSFVKNMI